MGVVFVTTRADNGHGVVVGGALTVIHDHRNSVHAVITGLGPLGRKLSRLGHARVGEFISIRTVGEFASVHTITEIPHSGPSRLKVLLVDTDVELPRWRCSRRKGEGGRAWVCVLLDRLAAAVAHADIQVGIRVSRRPTSPPSLADAVRVVSHRVEEKQTAVRAGVAASQPTVVLRRGGGV